MLLFVRFTAYKSTCLIPVTASGADTFYQIRYQLICVYFLAAASHGQLIAIILLIVHQTGMNLRHLNQKIANQTKDIRVTRLRLNYRIMIIRIVNTP